MKAGTLLAAFLLILPSAFTQEPEELMLGPDGGTRYFVEGISVHPLPGQPFSGKSTTEWTHNLEDISSVTTHLFAMVDRDSQGRIFREARSFVPANSDQQPKLNDIRIFDPITHA